MSTKIYNGWRCPTAALSDTLMNMRNHAFAWAVKEVRRVMRKMYLSDVIDTARNLSAQAGKDTTEVWRKLARLKLAVQHLKVGSASPEQQEFDIDCCVDVWVHKGFAYLVGHGECWEGYDPEPAEDYRYWNNVDPPDHVTPVAWESRRKMWNVAAFAGDWDSARMRHTIVKADRNEGLEHLIRLGFKFCKNHYLIIRP